MQYALDAGGTPDLAAIEAALADLDPAMLLDLDGHARRVRISTVLTHGELLAALQRVGVAATPDRLLLLPSECCGGCGG